MALGIRRRETTTETHETKSPSKFIAVEPRAAGIVIGKVNKDFTGKDAYFWTRQQVQVPDDRVVVLNEFLSAFADGHPLHSMIWNTRPQNRVLVEVAAWKNFKGVYFSPQYLSGDIWCHTAGKFGVDKDGAKFIIRRIKEIQAAQPTGQPVDNPAQTRSGTGEQKLPADR